MRKRNTTNVANFIREFVCWPDGSYSQGPPGPPGPPGRDGHDSGSTEVGQYIAEYLQSRTAFISWHFFHKRSSVTLFKTELPWLIGGDIRQYLAGPPGPSGPPGVPGTAGDELVDDVANRVLAYIQSENYNTTLQHQLFLKIMLAQRKKRVDF